MPWTLPTALTLLRIGLIPVFVLVFYLPVGWANEAATAVFALAALTDWLDGYLARRMGVTSAFGAFLDPVADKLMVAAVLVLVVQNDPRPWIAIAAVIIIGREIAISALREWMAQVGKQGAVAVSMIGKVKTTLQMVALLLLVYREPLLGIPVKSLGAIMLAVAAALTLWSMVHYLMAAWPQLKDRAGA